MNVLFGMDWYILLEFLHFFQAKKIEDHRRKYERKRTEREIEEKKERLRKAREEQAKAEAANKSKPDFGAGFGGMGGGTGDYKIPNEFMDIFNDPEIQRCFEVSNFTVLHDSFALICPMF